jgi:raffinose/stachyose/melibiose transport system permease protein
MYKNKKLLIAVFLLPALILFIVNVVYPAFASIYYSLFTWDGISKMEFAGLVNFTRMFKDPVFYKALLNSFYNVIGSGVVQVALGLFLAVILNSKIKGFKIFRTVFFFPVIVSAISIALMFSLIYEPQNGMLNSFLRLIHLGDFARPWLSDRKIVIFAAIFPQTWQYIGLMMMILLAALQNIPGDLLEYADIDGATGLKKTFLINIPLIWEAIQICVVLGVISGLKEFQHVYVLTRGGPMNSSELLSTYMYTTVFKVMEFGYGSALSFVIFVSGFLFTVVFKKYFSGDKIQY